MARQVAFSPEGRYLATANANGTVTILRVSPPPAYDPGPARPVPAAGELARRPSPADDLKEAIPEGLLGLAGRGEAAQAAAELVAVLGDARFVLPGQGKTSWMAHD